MFDLNKTYWNKSGKYQAEQAVCEALVPLMGKCDTLEGELVRASSKIYWDLYNNGFGNNWSGAYNFLEQYADMLGISEALEAIAYYRCGRIANYGKAALYEAVEVIADKVTEYVIAQNGVFQPNDVDMLDFSEEEDYGNDTDDDDSVDYYADDYADDYDEDFAEENA